MPESILIVEDEVEIADLVALYLTNEGFACIPFIIRWLRKRTFGTMRSISPFWIS